MDSKVRPIQISIIDFLGVIVPGLVWLLLVATALQMSTGVNDVVTPVTTWLYLSDELQRSNTVAVAAGLLLGSVVIGYAIKPKAMRIGGFFSLPLCRLHRSFANVPLREIRYPYRRVHEAKPFYPPLVAHLSLLMGCDVLQLPGNQPFTTAKRLLRQVAPRLWEECEHVEAEVRMIGALFIASVFSFALAGAELLRQATSTMHFSSPIAWLVLSVAAAVVLGDGFNHMRLREVEYAYLHALLASGLRKQNIAPVSD